MMNPVTAVVGCVIAGVLGFALEPKVSPLLLPQPVAEEPADEAGPSSAEQAEPTPEKSPAQPSPDGEDFGPAPAWVADLTSEQLPEKVRLRASASLSVDGSDEPMILPAGVSVTPVGIEGDKLRFSPFGGPLRGQVAVMATDLVEVLGGKPPGGESTPAMAAATPEASDPSPEVEASALEEPVETAKELTPEAIVELMQASVKEGAVKEFTFEEVTDWRAADDQEMDGEVFQIGILSYTAETIFGAKEIEAQALIKNGEITKWIWPKSGMEIK